MCPPPPRNEQVDREKKFLLQKVKACGENITCHEKRLLDKQAEISRNNYRWSLREIHPVFRQSISGHCSWDRATRDCVASRTRCYQNALATLRRDLRAVYFERVAGKSHSKLLQEITKQDHTLKYLIGKECGSKVSEDCFDKTLTAARKQIQNAHLHMTRSWNALARLDYMKAECDIVFKDGRCSRLKNWGDEATVHQKTAAWRPVEKPSDLVLPKDFAKTLKAKLDQKKKEKVRLSMRDPDTADEDRVKATKTHNLGAALDSLPEENISTVLNRCNNLYRRSKNADLHWDSEETCQALQGKEIFPFWREFSDIMQNSSAMHYFDTLRIRAITRILRGHREIVGTDIEKIPQPCKPFEAGIREFSQTEFADGLEKKQEILNSPEYRIGMKQAARDILFALKKAGELSAVPKTNPDCIRGPDEKQCPINPAWDRAQKELREIRQAIGETLDLYPYLGAGRELLKPYESYPNNGSWKKYLEGFAHGSTFDAELMKSARQSISALLNQSLERHCRKDKENGIHWTELIRNESLTKPTLDDRYFKQFKPVHECALAELDKRETAGNAAIALGSLGCIGPAFVGCVIASEAMLVKEISEKGRKARSKAECRSLGDRFCNEESALVETENLHQFVSAALPAAVVTDGLLLMLRLKQISRLKSLMKPDEAKYIQSRLSVFKSFRSPAGKKLPDAVVQSRMKQAMQAVDDIEKYAIKKGIPLRAALGVEKEAGAIAKTATAAAQKADAIKTQTADYLAEMGRCLKDETRKDSFIEDARFAGGSAVRSLIHRSSGHALESALHDTDINAQNLTVDLALAPLDAIVGTAAIRGNITLLERMKRNTAVSAGLSASNSTVWYGATADHSIPGGDLEAMSKAAERFEGSMVLTMTAYQRGPLLYHLIRGARCLAKQKAGGKLPLKTFVATEGVMFVDGAAGMVLTVMVRDKPIQK